MNAFQQARNSANVRLMDGMSRKVHHIPEKTLVIVDMQSGFMSEGEDVIVPAICSLIEHAKQNEWAIIVVEYSEFGETDETIHATIADYPHWATVFKRQCCGGAEVIRCIRDHPTWSMDLLVCGIYGDECVPQTVSGLFDSSDLVKVAVVTDAIFPDYMSCKEEHEEIEIETDDVVNCTSSVRS